jgi:hypothetical protein
MVCNLRLLVANARVYVLWTISELPSDFFTDVC